MYGYVVNIDYKKSINEQNLLHYTRVILAAIYRDFLCSDEKKLEIKEIEEKESIEYEKKLKEQYVEKELFIKSKEEMKEKIETSKAELTVRKESVFSKIKKKIRKIFYKTSWWTFTKRNY